MLITQKYFSVRSLKSVILKILEVIQINLVKGKEKPAPAPPLTTLQSLSTLCSLTLRDGRNDFFRDYLHSELLCVYLYWELVIYGNVVLVLSHFNIGVSSLFYVSNRFYSVCNERLEWINIEKIKSRIIKSSVGIHYFITEEHRLLPHQSKKITKLPHQMSVRQPKLYSLSIKALGPTSLTLISG